MFIKQRTLKIYRRQESGLVLVLMTLTLVILIAYMALAIDFSHLLLNKSRLQNGVDAAALSSAVVVDNSDDLGLARSAAVTTFSSFIAAEGNNEVDANYADNILVQFSNDPTDFNSVLDETTLSLEDIYVRVSIDQHALTNYFLAVFGIDKDIRASAVAGPSPAQDEVCNLVPLSVCSKTMNSAGEVIQKTFKDDFAYLLKDDDWKSTGAGAGNFQLLDLSVEDDSEKSGGGKFVREALAGNYEGCAIKGNTVVTKPGSTVGNVKKGLQIRIDSDGNDYSPNNTNQGAYDGDGATEMPINSTWNYSVYAANEDHTNRRVVSVPLLDCSTEVDKGNGKRQMLVEDFGCFFLLQKTDGKEVFGQFLENCPVKSGSGGIDPGLSGVYKIQLYKDPHSGDS
ncbi:pilus assembly protein TadG-related protein [Vibrio breoganii]